MWFLLGRDVAKTHLGNTCCPSGLQLNVGERENDRCPSVFTAMYCLDYSRRFPTIPRSGGDKMSLLPYGAWSPGVLMIEGGTPHHLLTILKGYHQRFPRYPLGGTITPFSMKALQLEEYTVGYNVSHLPHLLRCC